MLKTLIDKLIGLLPTDMQQRAKQARKAIVAGIGALLTVLTLLSDRFGFLVPENLKKPLASAISILTAVSTYLIPNEPAAT